MREKAALRLLESPGIEAVLAEAAAALLGPMNRWTLLRTHHRPGAGVTGIYSVQFGHRDGSLEGFLCVTTVDVPGGGHRSLQLEGPAGEILTVWSHPHDPMLPALPWSSNPSAVGQALFNDETASLSPVSYRPLRRAVLRASAGEEVRYLKVLRPGQASGLRNRHELLQAAGVPVPELIDCPIEELVVTEAASGVPLAAQLMNDGARLLDPSSIIELLLGLPADAMQLPARTPWAARVRDYAEGALAALPGEAYRIARIAETVEGLLAAAPTGPLVPTHGDFHEGNLLVTGNRITGVLDVDTLGPGRLVDDLACFLAHLAVLPSVDARYRHVPAALERFRASFMEVVDPSVLNAGAAGVALTLVAGAKRSTRPARSWEADALGRLQVAESFLRSARAGG